MNRTKTIITLGGSSFYRSDLVIENYILHQTQKPSPSILFVPTASGDSSAYIASFYQTFNQLECKPSHLSLFEPPRGINLQDVIMKQDIIFVGGGNTKNMLAIWRAWNFDELLTTAWEHGIILAGTSAGALCWFKHGVTDSLPSGLSTLNGLGLLNQSYCPHYTDEPDRKRVYHQMIANGTLQPGIGQEPYTALVFKNQTLSEVVSAQLNQRAYHVDRDEQGRVFERELMSRVIGL